MQNDQQKIDDFQARMSDWVASQGLAFQLSHGGSVRGARSTIFGWVTRMSLRLMVLLLVGCLIFLFYLIGRPSSEVFRVQISGALEDAMGAEMIEPLGPVTREDGYLELSSLDMKGGEDSFFDQVRLRNAKIRMGLLAGWRASLRWPIPLEMVADWDGEEVIIESLVLSVRAGSDDADGARIYQALFNKSEKFSFDRVEVQNASLSWGYSEVTKGKIENSRLSAQRKGEGWSVTFSGGTFSQNWLKDLEIDKLECELTRKGLEITDGRLKGKQGVGVLTLKAKVTGPVTGPQVSGSGTMQGIPFDSYLEAEVRPFVGGRLSGNFNLGGSPYISSGITMAAQIALEADDEIVIRDKIKLLDAISLVDRHRSYNKVRFRGGSFNFETGKKVASFTDINLEATDHMTLEGEFISRPPSPKEVSDAIYFDEHGSAPPPSADDEETNELSEGADVTDFNLADAAQAAREESDSDPKLKTIFESEVFGLEVARREEEARARYRRIPFVQGVLNLGLHARAFEPSRSRELAEMYPIDEKSGLRWLRINLDQGLPSAGVAAAEKILLHAKD